MVDKLKVGVVGCGAVAIKRHIPAFRKIKNVEIQSVCDRNIDMAENASRNFNIPLVYKDLGSMLLENELDIVDICTPPQTHALLAVEALRYGSNVLLEKPMALTMLDCDDMIDASHRYGKKLCVVHNVLFHPPLVEARHLVGIGAIGEVTGVRVFLADPKEEMIMRKDYWIHKLPGGLIGETCPHPVYLSLAFMDGVTNADVFAKNILEHSWARFDEFRIELEGKKTASSITISYSGNRYNATMDILGTKGMLTADLQSMILYHYGAKPLLDPWVATRNSLSLIGQTICGVLANGVKMASGKMKLGHDNVIEQFVKSVSTDTKPPVTGEEGREVVRVMGMIVNRLYEKYGR